ncbi:hypothetical protein SLE2022_161420 [Rubroshorea leprosula]
MATGAAQMGFQVSFDGSIAANDKDIQWRPYHRNCGCRLHKLKGSSKPHVCSQPTNVAFPQKQWQSDCSWSMAISRLSSQSSLPDDLSLCSFSMAASRFSISSS